MNRIEFYSKLDKYKADKANEEKEQNGGTLSHYGIPKMKWGHRRWQNADGTFNEEGKIRYFGKNGTTKKNKEEKPAGKNGKDQKIGGWYMNSIENAYMTPKTASERAVADLRVNDRIKNETIDSFENSKKNRLAKIMDGDYFDRLNRMQSALSKGKTEKYNKLLNKFNEEDRELVEDYVKKLNDNINDHRDSYLYDFNNNKEKFYAEIKAREKKAAEDMINKEREAEAENNNDQKIGATGIYDIAAGVISVKNAINNYDDVQALRSEYGNFMKNSDQNYSDDERLSVLNNKKKIAKMQNALEFGDEKAYNKLLGKVKSKDKEAVEKFLKDLNQKNNELSKPDEDTAKKLEDSVFDERVGSLSKPKVSRQYLKPDGTLNEAGKRRTASNRKVSDVASSVFLALRNFKLFELASLPVAGAALALSGFGVPAVLATALAGAIVAPSAAIDNTLYKKLEKRADAYYDMLNK